MKSTTRRLVFGLLATGALMAGTHAAQAQSSCPGAFSMAAASPHSLMAETDEKIHGRDRFAVIASFRDRGVRVTAVEAWGGQIKAKVVDPNCSIHTQYFDPDTLQSVAPVWE